MSEPNPYQPPTQASLPPDEPQPDSPAKDWLQTRKFLIRWGMLMGVNSIVPMILAREVVLEKAYPGMFAGMFACLVGGAWLCIRFPVLQRPIVAGSYVTAITQFVPIGQVICGMLAIAFCDALNLCGDWNDTNFQPELIASPIGAFAVTVTTGILLALIALTFGGIIVAVSNRLFGKPQQPS
ncbi:hypothetical protein SAMN06265222_107261 [Neorhodopirellula lusitana]|uniref:Uncharacterized protein n=1 Tax=Neorhodopirellula lusitana TaxID=445327 RepID=A0ABY1QBW0_9BACT|nr:hypothetical protein [Neorhodopirellula lusitana]SMP62203.1 hypothetical protein SAMN06265222_107261 [Neorhodopirellula lusitana]